MCEFTGPISTLPGHLYKVPEGTSCDTHTTIPAVYRVQGETDSMGAELLDMCSVCYTEHLAGIEAAKKEIGVCEWCAEESDNLVTTRDYEEGMSGPIYEVCPACITTRLNQCC